ncbi:MAG: HTTM domain-containing protein [Flavobacteriales bacterium]|nr:HTTM domain-containing protein [Flavobacteriales bacterium]
MSLTLQRYQIKDPVHIAPLAIFRVIFGAVMTIATVRFILKGWVYEQYIKPGFYFPYFGFEWVKPLDATGMYAVFTIMAISYLMVMIGWRYRFAVIVSFITFTYVELIDKTNYLNHYYFISIINFLLIFLPANRYFSVDVRLNPALLLERVPTWMVDVIRWQLAIVYIYAGIAKLNSDWLFNAMPLKIWLPAHSHLPLIGSFLTQEWTAYVFSWFGAAYDLFIVFFLWNARTRPAAYMFVIIFHALTAWLFPIGMFPYVMIFSTLIFFPEDFHLRLIRLWRRFIPVKNISPASGASLGISRNHRWIMALMVIHFTIQVLLPWRFLLYPGNLFWTEQGYRFSWRVMLMEKAGTAFFYVRDGASGRESEVNNNDYLTRNQEKMMATQPDMILQFAHHIHNVYREKGMADPHVRVESYATLNGSGSRTFIDHSVNLAAESESFRPKHWILPYTPMP